MKYAVITTLLTFLFTGAAMAGGATGSGKGAEKMGLGAGQSMEQMRATQELRFRNIDGNQDGFITRKEAENHQRLITNWDKADANADGKLDSAEFSAFEEVVPPGRNP